MSGITAGTATLLIGGAGLAATAYTANEQRKDAKKLGQQQIAQTNDLAAKEEERVREQMALQAQAAATAAQGQRAQIAAAAAAAAKAEQTEKARAAADLATREAAKQADAAKAQVDVAGASEGSRGKRRRSFFNQSDNASGAAGGGFRV
jgi:hypothetical protein